MIDNSVLAHVDSMRTAARNAIELVDHMSYEQFVGDVNAQAAAAMFLIIIGEAATRIAQASPSFAESNPGLPWEKMRGLRNRIVHEYETLHLPTIWATARESLPDLLTALDKLDDPPQIAT